MVVSADPRNATVRRQVESVSFGFYSDDEVRCRAVMEVTSPQAFDRTAASTSGAPAQLKTLPGGLYDERMGPFSDRGTSRNSVCVTCGATYSACPGHAGVIELCVPVMQPLLTPVLLRMMKIKCMACHKLRLPELQLKKYLCQFIYLSQNKLQEALSFDHEIQAYLNRQGGDDKNENKRVLKEKGTRAALNYMNSIIQQAEEEDEQNQQDDNHRYGQDFLYQVRETRRSLRHDFESAFTSIAKCAHCGAGNSKFRLDSHNKIFQAPLSKSTIREHRAQGIVIRSALKILKKENKNNDNQDDYDDDDDDDDIHGESTMDDGFDEEEEAEDEAANKFFHTLEVEAQIKLTWRHHAKLLTHVFGASLGLTEGTSYRDGYKYLFLRAVPVPPSRFRPPMVLAASGMAAEHVQNVSLNRVLVYNDVIRKLMYSKEEDDDDDDEMKDDEMKKDATINKHGRAIQAWIDLQSTVNTFMDASKNPNYRPDGNQVPRGVRQMLERKEGIFRKHMMGKRVDYACRSVISPDPYIGANEIGIPHYFATKLTFPTPVSLQNLQEMKTLIERGTSAYPGARWVEFPTPFENTGSGGSSRRRRVDLSRMNAVQRQGLSATLLAYLTSSGNMTTLGTTSQGSTSVVPGSSIGASGSSARLGALPPPIVGRNLRDGDMMLVNRQPTLHKPGIMAHSVRVLHNPTQKTIRMHYANCNTYNADFDGDEMNCHFPQSFLAAAESKYIAATDLQYIVPTDGSPLRGLIQDHVDAGVKLCNKDSFLEKWEYQQLVFASLSSLSGLEVIRMDAEIEMLPPAIVKPRQLWTGKQVISTLLHHLRKGNDKDDVAGKMPEFQGISVSLKSKTPPSGFGESMEEHLVLIRDGELLRGVLDKAAFGHSNYSLVHAVYEAYGHSKAGILLNAFARLFTAYLQYYSGHSCRMEDLMLTAKAEKERHRLIQRAYNLGSRAAKAWADAEGGKMEIKLKTSNADGSIPAPLKPVERAATAAKIGSLLSGNEGADNFAALDGFMQSKLNPMASEIIKACLPHGLEVPFPTNTFGLMVSTGAKGSTVNQSQVSCALGQQALEGRRVPRLSSGRTLPSFAPYDPNPRADGFITDRFLTGIRPQEYYFHCMAGREGLVDTAVKTSRSGYLQRCLVKHLEELKVCYDSTVRNAEGGVVQFVYGEDGLDPTKAAFLDSSPKTFEYLLRNHNSLSRRHKALPDASIELASKDAERVKSIKKGEDDLLTKGSFVLARRLRVGSRWVRGALCRGWFEAIIMKANDDDTYNIKYIKDGKQVLDVPIEVSLGRCGGHNVEAACNMCTLIKPAVPDPLLSGAQRGDGKIHRAGQSGLCVSEKVAGNIASTLKENAPLKRIRKLLNVSSKQLGKVVAAKYSSGLCAPGEAVGCIAAQSVGEPSTQMTLNTFHLAGSGANVTLGIPRLREIIMTASKELKTPTMSVPLHESLTERDAVRLTRAFTRITLLEVISSNKGVVVTETLMQGDSGAWERAYHVALKFHPAERIKAAFQLSLVDIAKVVAKKLMPKIVELMKRELKKTNKTGVGATEVHGGQATVFHGDEEPENTQDGDDLEEAEEDVDEDGVNEEDGVTASRFGFKEEVDGYDEGADEEDHSEDTDATSTSDDSDDSGDDEKSEGSSSDDESSTSGSSSSKSVSEDGSDSESLEKQQAGEQTEENESFRPVLNMSTQPKIDRRQNAIYLPALRVDPSERPFLMVELVERAASTLLLRSKDKIEKGFVTDEEGRGRCLQTAGVNFSEVWKLNNVDHNRLASNDIWAIRCAYGVEAARNNIVEQIRSVFGVYGISVDPRHLALIADYMTFEGGFKPMSRFGMKENSSPLLQMSFESTTTFMADAALDGRADNMNTPSANIVLGRPIRHGTGAFDVFVKS